jgi:hypothetical protein
MNIGNILSIASIVAAAGGFVVGLCILLSDRRSGRGMAGKIKDSEQTLAALDAGLKECRAVVDALQEEMETRALDTAPASSINTNTRGRVLWLNRSGQSPEAIARCLSLPLREVELLVKVHQIALGHCEKTA